MHKDLRTILKTGVVCSVLTLWVSPVLAAPWHQDAQYDGARTPADVLHPNIHDNNGAGNNANPNGKNPQGKKFEGQDVGGGNMHGIANAKGGNGGVANLGNVHGGIQAVNKNVLP